MCREMDPRSLVSCLNFSTNKSKLISPEDPRQIEDEVRVEAQNPMTTRHS